VKEGDLEAIKALKYATSHLDLKEFDDLGALLTADATASYEDGRRSYEGRDPSSAFSRRRSAIQASSPSTRPPPEITFSGDDEATGRWYLEDRVIIPSSTSRSQEPLLRGSLRARRLRWRIAHTGYERSSRSAEPLDLRALLVHDPILNR